MRTSSITPKKDELPNRDRPILQERRLSVAGTAVHLPACSSPPSTKRRATLVSAPSYVAAAMCQELSAHGPTLVLAPPGMETPKSMWPSERMDRLNLSAVGPRKSDPYSKITVSSTGGPAVLNHAVMVLGALPAGRVLASWPVMAPSSPLNVTPAERFPGTHAAVPVSRPRRPLPLESSAESPVASSSFHQAASRRVSSGAGFIPRSRTTPAAVSSKIAP